MFLSSRFSDSYITFAASVQQSPRSDPHWGWPRPCLKEDTTRHAGNFGSKRRKHRTSSVQKRRFIRQKKRLSAEPSRDRVIHWLISASLSSSISTPGGMESEGNHLRGPAPHGGRRLFGALENPAHLINDAEQRYDVASSHPAYQSQIRITALCHAMVRLQSCPRLAHTHPIPHDLSPRLRT